MIFSKLAASVLEPSLCPYFVRPDGCEYVVASGSALLLSCNQWNIFPFSSHEVEEKSRDDQQTVAFRRRESSCGEMEGGENEEGRNMFADGQMDDLVCFEELADYQLVSCQKFLQSFSKEEESPKKRKKAQAVAEERKESLAPQKKKMKLKKGIKM